MRCRPASAQRFVKLLATIAAAGDAMANGTDSRRAARSAGAARLNLQNYTRISIGPSRAARNGLRLCRGRCLRRRLGFRLGEIHGSNAGFTASGGLASAAFRTRRDAGRGFCWPRPAAARREDWRR